MSEIDTDSPEFKKAVKDAIEEATSGLVAKRDELLREVKKLKQGAAVDPADLERAETERDAARAEAAEAKKAAAKAQKESEAAIKRADEAAAATTKLLVDNGLNEALTKAGVTNPHLVKAAKALLTTQAQVHDGVAKIGDKPLADAIGEWAGTDEGKHFVTAPNNEGGGSQGGRGNNLPQPKGDSGGDKTARLARATELLTQPED